MSLRVALVETDLGWAREIEALLANAGYSVDLYQSLGRFMDGLIARRPDVLLMDMHLPGMEGREILRALRANSETARMILVGLSSRPRTKDEVAAAFKAGADEYFFKPLDAALLVVRLTSLLRRAPAAAAEPCLRHAAIEVYLDSRACRVDGAEVRLTRLEFDLLVEFVRNPQRVLTRGGLIDALWNGSTSRGSRAVDRHISALRGKLGRCGGLLETLVGIGYRLTNGPERPGRPARASAAARS